MWRTRSDPSSSNASSTRRSPPTCPTWPRNAGWRRPTAGTSPSSSSRSPTTAPAAVHGELDLADALDLEHAIAGLAAQLKDLGSEDSLDVRRAAAVGELARAQLSLDLTDTDPRWLRRALAPVSKPPPVRSGRWSSTSTSPEQPSKAIGTARLEQGNQLITAGQVRDWCHTAGNITVKPVIDLEAHDPVDSPDVPDRHAEHHHRPGQDLRVPLVHPPRPPLRHRPHHPRRPRRTHLPVQPGPVVPTTSPDQDPRPLDLHHPRTRRLSLDLEARLPVPPRPRRHPRRQPRPTWFRDRRCAPSSTTEPFAGVATQPQTPPVRGAIGTPGRAIWVRSDAQPAPSRPRSPPVLGAPGVGWAGPWLMYTRTSSVSLDRPIPTFSSRSPQSTEVRTTGVWSDTSRRSAADAALRNAKVRSRACQTVSVSAH